MKCPRCFFTDAVVDDETCRECSRNFTRTELVEVVLLGLVYLFICRFSYFLFTGDFFSGAFKGGVFFPVSFTEIFTFPVDVTEHPWHLLTVGWTFALILLVPAFVGLFYGPVPGMVVALVGGWHVVAPFFFLLVMLTALMAGTRVRGLLRVEAALFVGTVGPFVFLFVLMLPAVLGRLGLIAWLPWLVSVVIVTGSVPWVLWHARRNEYDARFLLWFTGAQVVVLLVLFHATVGFAKVEYEFVREKHWTGGPRFRIPVEAADALHTVEEQRKQARGLFELRRDRALRSFSQFIGWFPRAPETPLALFERAEIHNLRCYFAGTRPDQLHVYTTRITADALQDYETIRTDFAASPAAPVARLRIARYHLQHHYPAEAAGELRNLIDTCDLDVPVDYRPRSERSVFLHWRQHRLTSEENTRLLFEVVQEARKEQRFLEADSDYNRIPLMLFYQLDEHERGYDAEVAKILKWFPDSKLADNLKLILMERREFGMDELQTLLDTYPKGDAAPRMLLLLGAGWRDRDDPARAETFLRRLMTEFPRSPEAERAKVLLKTLEK